MAVSILRTFAVISLFLSIIDSLTLMKDDRFLFYSENSSKFNSLDQAHLKFSSKVDFSIAVYSLSDECDRCALKWDIFLEPQSNHSLLINTTFGITFFLKHSQFINGNDSIVCSFHKKFTEYGEYWSIITEEQGNHIKCEPFLTNNPGLEYLPLLIAACVLVGLFFLWIIGKWIFMKGVTVFDKFGICSGTLQLINNDLGDMDSPNLDVNREGRQRLKSLDTFRGLSIAIMIFVNCGGGRYWFFKHSAWNGLTVADVVFPWFMFMMGVAIPLSQNSMLRKGMHKRTILWKICKRSLLLFVLGVAIESKKKFVTLNNLRIMGVLQRFGLSYFIAATTELISIKQIDLHQFVWWAPLRDVLDYWFSWIIATLITIGHTLITFLLPVPGCPLGYLGPGGLHLNYSYPSCIGGAAGYIDRLVLGENHMYCSKRIIYETTTCYDPEGILGTLTATLIVFLGIQAGRILLTYPLWVGKIKRWFFWGLLTGVSSIILCKANKNDGWIPINKNLWSLSYVLAMASTAYILIIIFYIVIDVKKWISGAPLYQAGMNSLLLYCGHEFLMDVFPISWKVENTHTMQLAIDLWGMAFWLIIAIYCHYVKFFLVI